MEKRYNYNNDLYLFEQLMQSENPKLLFQDMKRNDYKYTIEGILAIIETCISDNQQVLNNLFLANPNMKRNEIEIPKLDKAKQLNKLFILEQVNNADTYSHYKYNGNTPYNWTVFPKYNSDENYENDKQKYDEKFTDFEFIIDRINDESEKIKLINTTCDKVDKLLSRSHTRNYKEYFQQHIEKLEKLKPESKADEPELKPKFQIEIIGNFEQFKKDAIKLFSQNNKGKTILNEADVLYWINQNFKQGEVVPEYKTFKPECNNSDLHHIIFLLQKRYAIHKTKVQWFDCLNECFQNHKCTDINNLKWYPDKSYLNTI